MTSRQDLARKLRQQAGWCREFGSPFYEVLLEAAAIDAEREGPVWNLLRDNDLSAVPLRLLGAVHRLVLNGALPELAAHYPSVGGDGDASSAVRPLLTAIEACAEDLLPLTRLPVQTNEVGRSAVLVGASPQAARARCERRLEPPLGSVPIRVLGRGVGRFGRRSRFLGDVRPGTAVLS